MAGEVVDGGKVLPPLNIANPAPILDLRGFQWGTVDEKIHGPSRGQADGRNDLQGNEHPPKEQAFVAAGVAHTSHHAMAGGFSAPFTAPPLVQAPQIPPEPAAAAAAEQFAGQVGFISAKPADVPNFPLALFQGAYAGNGFNTIFRPRSTNDNTPFAVKPTGPNDQILELNLTTEQLTFGASIGKIPNRGLGPQDDITLAGVPYVQTIQDVTNPDTGKGDRLDPVGIHFEPGMWLFAPPAKFQKNVASVVRMASIPHGTTINAQGLIPTSVTASSSIIGGVDGPPKIDDIDTTPFPVGADLTKNPSPRLNGVFLSMDADNQATFRIPQNLEPFNEKGTQRITTKIIKNPNLVLKKAIEGQTITETISFEVSTGAPTALLNGSTVAQLNGGGTTNISFLAGKQDPITTNAPTIDPIAHAGFMKAKYWIEVVRYKVTVPRVSSQTTFQLKPTMPVNSTAPTPVFAITTPPNGIPKEIEITVPGIQIQTSQMVNLNFGPPAGPALLTWPHVSVSTLVPTGPQPFRMT